MTSERMRTRLPTRAARGRPVVITISFGVDCSAILPGSSALFLTERIPPGEYVVVASAYAPLTEEQKVRSGIVGPAWTARAPVVVPESGDVAAIRLQLTAGK